MQTAGEREAFGPELQPRCSLAIASAGETKTGGGGKLCDVKKLYFKGDIKLTEVSERYYLFLLISDNSPVNLLLSVSKAFKATLEHQKDCEADFTVSFQARPPGYMPGL